MQYKTLTLGLIEARPPLHRRLKSSRRLMATMERHARGLRESHQGWTVVLASARPADDPRTLASEALELALAELASLLDAEASATASAVPTAT